MDQSARRIVLSGAVQGCGLRPALARLAANQSWSGSVRNTFHGVELILQGRLPADEELRAMLIEALPSAASIDQVNLQPLPNEVRSGFRILESSVSGPLTARIPRDRAICHECIQELHDPGNRRYQYPFITCAECGPRFSILLSMPFDRERTAMRVFEMCRECRREYENPHDRRFHAQTISCPQCGPRLWVSNGREILRNSLRTPWEIAADGLRRGKIVALRGIGGYQLLVDATSSAAVGRLRQRKQRPAKPFAVLCRDSTAAWSLAQLDRKEVEQLESAANPIVVVRQRFPSPVSFDLNPGLNEIGLMFPTTALHDLLLAVVGRPLVCTSGNRDGDPLAFQCDDAEVDLSGIADLFLHHDREILHPIDDSVVRVIAHRPVTLRPARGIAPLPFEVSTADAPPLKSRTFLACGGQQKSTLAWQTGGQTLLGPHLGDLETLACRERWDEQRQSLSQLTNCRLDTEDTVLICDPHPGYAPTQWATSRTASPDLVWHHHAHITAGMLEHGWLDREVLGVAWDGTGLGPDGAIWGGEILRATATSFARVAHLRPFQLPGSEAAISDLRRTALAILIQLDEFPMAELSESLQLTQPEICRWISALKPAFSPITTSCGRLFDAAACLILNQTKSEFEGHAALCLEAACDPSAAGAYDFSIDQQFPAHLDWRPVIRSIVSDRRDNVPHGTMAMKFHRGLAQLILDVADRFPELPVILGGGVFQNRVLVELVAENWPSGRIAPGLPGLLPPNDAGLAAGQLAVAVVSISNREKTDVPRSSRPPGRLDQSRSVVGRG